MSDAHPGPTGPDPRPAPAAPPVPGGAAVSPVDREAVLSVAAILPHWLATVSAVRRLTGVQAAIWHDGELVCEVAVGAADETTGTQLATTHRLRIASHSKMFTALAVMRLAEQGALRLDDTLGERVAELAGSPVASLTLHDLLSHSAGLTRDGADASWWNLERPFPDRAALLQIARTSAAVLAPGLHLQYSNIGYGLLGLVIEDAAGTPFDEAVRTLVLDPAGVGDIGPDLPPDAPGPEDPHGFAPGHTSRLHGDRRAVEQIPTGALAAATGFWATAGAIATFAGRALTGDAVVSEAGLRRMRRRVWTVADGAGYGLGLQEATIHGLSGIGHSGGFPTGLTRTWAVPASRLAVSVLGTSIDAPASDLAAGVLGMLALASGSAAAKAAAHERSGALGGGSDGRRRPKPLAEQDEVAIGGAPMPAARLARIVAGSYDSLWGRTRLAVLGGRLFALDDDALDPAETALELRIGAVVAAPSGGGEDEGSADPGPAGTVILELPAWGDSGYGAWAEPLRVRLVPGPEGLRPVSLWITGQTLLPAGDVDLPGRIRAPR